MINKLLKLDVRYTARLRIAEKPGLLRNLAIFFAHLGDSWFWLLGLGVVWWLGTDTWKMRASVLMLGVLATATLVMLIKFTVRRRRPEGEWGGVYRKTDPHSFPSGHAARSGMLMVVGLGLGPTWFSIALLVLMPLVPLARVAMGVHYVLDVIAGVLFGAVIGAGILGILPRLAFLFNYF